MKIIENVYVVPKVVANTYILGDPDGLTIIDTGIPGSDKKILAYIAGLGRSARDIRRILLTHSDMDHIGSLAALRRATGARIYAGRIEAEAIAAGKSSRPVETTGLSLARLRSALVDLLFKIPPVQIDEILSDGQVLPVLGALRVVETPGHTPGHVSFFAPAAGLLFCGDSMVVDAKGIRSSRPDFTWDEAKARESVRKQAALGAQIVCSGHGPVVREANGKFPVV